MLTLGSFVALATFEAVRTPRNAFCDLSATFTDHFSHLNAGRLFTRFGLGVWKKPLAETLPPLSAEQRAALPADVQQCRDGVYLVPGWRKPVEQSWPMVVRFYPPGDLLLTAPIALLYHFTGLSFTAANRLLLILLLALAHLGLFLFLDGLREEGLGLALVPAFLGVNVVLHWTLEGFYDAAMLIPLLLCFRALARGRGLAAAVLFCAAIFLHFRAAYYLPWGVAAVALIVREQSFRRWSRLDLLAAAAGLALALASLGSFLLTLPGLMAFRDSPSALLIAAHHVDRGALIGFALVLALAFGALFLARASLDVAVLAWLSLLLTVVRQSYAWYAIALVPWLGAPVDRREGPRAALVVAARALVFIFLAVFVHADGPDGAYAIEGITPLWISRLCG